MISLAEMATTRPADFDIAVYPIRVLCRQQRQPPGPRCRHCRIAEAGCWGVADDTRLFSNLAGISGDPDTIQIDTTHLEAHRTAHKPLLCCPSLSSIKTRGLYVQSTCWRLSCPPLCAPDYSAIGRTDDFSGLRSIQRRVGRARPRSRAGSTASPNTAAAATPAVSTAASKSIRSTVSPEV